jgi:ketosteroid isomerase-like protein
VLEQENTKIIQDAYTAFGRGDIAALLDILDDEVLWSPLLGASPKIATAGDWRGKAGVQEFFQRLGGECSYQMFEPREFIAQGETVVALGRFEGTANATGRKFASDWAMVFSLRNGKITRFREYADSSAVNEAFV